MTEPPTDALPVWPVPGRRVPRVVDIFLSRRAWAVEAQVSRDARRALLVAVGALSAVWLAGTSAVALLWWDAFQAFTMQSPFIYFTRVVLTQVVTYGVCLGVAAWRAPHRLGLVDGPWLDEVRHPGPRVQAPPRARAPERAADARLPTFDTLKTLG